MAKRVLSQKILKQTYDSGLKTQDSFMKIARKFYISGLVQGVGFRFFTQRAAAKHQVRGYVKNLEDGRVEVYAEGEEKAIKAFYEDILTGPNYARVEEIEEIVLEPKDLYYTFLIEK